LLVSISSGCRNNKKRTPGPPRQFTKPAVWLKKMTNVAKDYVVPDIAVVCNNYIIMIFTELTLFFEGKVKVNIFNDFYICLDRSGIFR
jgi:hypothetical protein